MTSTETEQRNVLEKLMRACVEDVRQEVTRKRMEGPTAYSKKKNMTKQEKDKIIEVLLS